jgi:hypothetical protein
VGAVPLFFRRTTTLGALITGGALVNVFMLDISYDVPEKLDVLWMLATTLFILWADLRLWHLQGRRVHTEWPGVTALDLRYQSLGRSDLLVAIGNPVKLMDDSWHCH